jgi:hypothetical protein
MSYVSLRFGGENSCCFGEERLRLTSLLKVSEIIEALTPGCGTSCSRTGWAPREHSIHLCPPHCAEQMDPTHKEGNHVGIYRGEQQFPPTGLPMLGRHDVRVCVCVCVCVQQRRRQTSSLACCQAPASRRGLQVRDSEQYQGSVNWSQIYKFCEIPLTIKWET